MTIRVVIVEDSPTMRALLMARLSRESDIEVVATAANAQEGRELIRQFDPDVVTLDIEMPGMNGLDFLDKIMALRPTPVIIISGSTQEGAETTAEALARGAVACYAKTPGGDAFGSDPRLAALIREAAQVHFNRPVQPGAAPMQAGPIATHKPRSGPPRLIAIGASTGGVEALHAVLANFPADCPPTLVVQHVNARFAPSIANSLDRACTARVMLAEADLPLKPGHVYVAPGDDRHLTVGGGSLPGSAFHVRLRRGPPVSGHLPSVDALFMSVAERLRADAAGILLTGMGSDGAQGLLAMHRAGALTIAQDESTSTVFGMPRAAITLGAAEVVAPLHAICDQLFRVPA